MVAGSCTLIAKHGGHSVCSCAWCSAPYIFASHLVPGLVTQANVFSIGDAVGLAIS